MVEFKNELFVLKQHPRQYNHTTKMSNQTLFHRQRWIVLVLLSAAAIAALLLTGRPVEDAVALSLTTTKHETTRSIDNTTSLSTTHNSSSSEFIVYFSHGGFSNQLIGLHHAAQFAYATGRVLVVPPILPHSTKEMDCYDDWYPRAGGGGCRKFNAVHNANKAVNQAETAMQLEEWDDFPSYHSVVDFEHLQNRTGLQLIDMDEFMKRQVVRSSNINVTIRHSYTKTSKWCTPNILQEFDKKHDKKCRQGLLSFDNITQKFHGQVDTKDCPVANIGSGFILPRSMSDSTSTIFDDFFFNYPLVAPWKNVLRTLLLDIPHQSFVGVHVRTKDKSTECEDSTAIFKEAAQKVLQEISNCTTNPSLVLIGRVNKNSRRCLEEAVLQEMKIMNSSDVQIMPTIVTTNDLIDASPHHSNLTTWLESIELEWSTIYLLLDQFMLSMSSPLIMTSYSGKTTFQLLLNRRHEHRKENLKALGFSP